jgi:hypothetical protein
MNERSTERPICINYGCERPCIKSTATKYRPVCWRCHKASYGARDLEEGVTFAKKEYCENKDGSINGYQCTAYIPYRGALELDHIDGDPLNNSITNVQTLCKICHSYKGHIKGDFKRGRFKHNG